MNAPVEAITQSPFAELARLFELQRAAFGRERYPAEAIRRDRLDRLRRIVTQHESEMVDAISTDFGHRSAHETRLAELYIVAAEARHAQRKLRAWMKRRRVATPIHLRPASAFVMRQPLGVVGVISPWNYPVQLALAPVVGALAAGNRVLLKPSELTPATSALLQRLVARYFAPDEFAVVIGDVALGEAFARLPLDHLFFTGSTAVGRKVAQAAAANLTPVTLELGGKSPALFDVDADFTLTVPRLVVGKLLNAGQTCIAPDYAIVPRSRIEEFESAVASAVAALYPDIVSNDDYSTIVNDRHFARLQHLLEDARSKGARVVQLGASSPTTRRMPPALVIGVDDSMAIMREEIFGPLLPVEAYDSLDEMIARLNARPHPLAFYWFGRQQEHRDKVLQQTLAGGVTVNDTLWHFAHEGLPFGGVGASGSGAYHGERSFVTFSQEKPVFVQPRLAATRLLNPPYRKTFERILALLRRLNT
ncbi:MAG TPA: coniferyl aldehyde dehydrogenase [Casimicrobiaceae bacterium]|nr:coniferyl aldehyde dehydrogenase [Casimicrobiaceae bacterium]